MQDLRIANQQGTSVKSSNPHRVDFWRIAGVLGLSIIGVVEVVMLFAGALRSGVSWDEPIEVSNLQGTQSTSDPSSYHFGVYGLSYQLLGHFAGWIFGDNQVRMVSYTAQTYEARHLAVASLTLFTAVTVALTVKTLTRSWLIGGWSGAALLAIPVFAGHGFFNPKDIPFAAGYTCVTAACVLILSQASPASESRRFFLIPILLLSFGMWIAIGTRYAAFFPLAISMGATVFLVLLIRQKHRATVKSGKPAFLSLGLGFGGGLFLLAVTNPCVLAPVSPDCRFGLSLVAEVFRSTSSFPYGNPVFLAGELLNPQNLPWWYIPVALLAGVPILILLFAVVGLFLSWVLRGPLMQQNATLMPLLPTLQLLVTPLAAIFLGSVSYDGNRHHLYVYPAIAIFAGLGLYLLERWTTEARMAARPPIRSIPKMILPTVAGIALVLPVVESLRLFPYSYVYVNPVASLDGFEDNWETDYWAVSFREAISLVPEGADFYVIGPPGSATPFLSEQGSSNEASKAALAKDEAFAIQIHRPSFDLGQPLSECREVDRVERTIRGMRIPMSYVLICDGEVLKPYQRLPL